MSERRGFINFMAHQLLAGRPIPFFVSKPLNLAVERRADEIVAYRKQRRFKARRTILTPKD